MKIRADQLLVDRGLADSREKAKALVLAGAVRVNGQKLDKPWPFHRAGCKHRSHAKAPLCFTRRLEARSGARSIRHRSNGMTCLDIGSSTGGFTDCLLQRGAVQVYAIDSGTSQLDWKIRSDARVLVKENYNARHLDVSHFPAPVDLLVCDVSFISVTLVLPPAQALLREGAQMVILIKPQFEAGR